MRSDHGKVLRRGVDTVADVVRLDQRCGGYRPAADYRFRSGFIDQCTAAAGGRFYETNLDSGQILVRGQLRTRPPDRKWRARRRLSFGGLGVDGLSTDAKSDSA